MVYQTNQDVEYFIDLFDKHVEKQILFYLGLLTEFELVIYLNYDEMSISVHKDKNVIFETNLTLINSNKNIIFNSTDLSLEINCVFKKKKKFSEVNNTFYYVLKNQDNIDFNLEDFDDGVIISNSIYNMSIDDYLSFKASLIASLAKEAVNAREALYTVPLEDTARDARRIIDFYIYHNKYKHISQRSLFKHYAVKCLINDNVKRLVKSLLRELN